MGAGTCRAPGGRSCLTGACLGSFSLPEDFHILLGRKAELPFQFGDLLIRGTLLVQQLSSLRMLLPERSNVFHQVLLSASACWEALLLQPALNFLSVDVK